MIGISRGVDAKKDPNRDFEPAAGEQRTEASHRGRRVISTRAGIPFLTGSVKSVGGSILKSDSVAGRDATVSEPPFVDWPLPRP